MKSGTRLYFTVSLFKNGSRIKHTHTSSKRRLMSKLTREDWDLAGVVVEYRTASGKRIGSNRTECTSRDDVVSALDKFCEPDLLTYLEETS
jgi:hypothetical protein